VFEEVLMSAELTLAGESAPLTQQRADDYTIVVPSDKPSNGC
jgi:hypothetical protein